MESWAEIFSHFKLTLYSLHPIIKLGDFLYIPKFIFKENVWAKRNFFYLPFYKTRVSNLFYWKEELVRKPLV